MIASKTRNWMQFGPRVQNSLYVFSKKRHNLTQEIKMSAVDSLKTQT